MTARRLTRRPGGARHALAGMSAEEILTWLSQRGIDPPLNRTALLRVLERLAGSPSASQPRTLWRWEAWLREELPADLQGTVRRRRAAGLGYRGGDGFIDLPSPGLRHAGEPPCYELE